MTITKVAEAKNTGSGAVTADLTGLVAAGDLIVVINHAFDIDSAHGGSIPADVVPTGFSSGNRIDISHSGDGTPFGGIAYRVNAFWKTATGSEGVISGMNGPLECDINFVVFRSNVAGTWDVPIAATYQANGAGVSNGTVPSVTAPYVVVISTSTANNAQDYASTPSPDGVVWAGGALNTGYNVFNSSPSSVVFTGSANRTIFQGWSQTFTASGGGASPFDTSILDRPTRPVSVIPQMAQGAITGIFLPNRIANRPPGRSMFDPPVRPIPSVVARSMMTDIETANILYIAQLPKPFGRISMERPAPRPSPWPALNATIQGLPPYYFPVVTVQPFFGSMLDMPPAPWGSQARWAQASLQWPRLLVAPRPVGGLMMDGVVIRASNVTRQAQMVNTIVRSTAPVVTSITRMWISS